MLKKGTPASPATARGEEGLAGAGRPDQEDAARDARAQGGEAFGELEEFDDFLQLFFGFVGTGDVVEGDGGAVGGDHPRLALAERHGLRALPLRLAEEEEDDADDDDEGEEADEDVEDGAAEAAGAADFTLGKPSAISIPSRARKSKKSKSVSECSR